MTSQAVQPPADVLPLPGLSTSRPVGTLEREARAHVDRLAAAGRLDVGDGLLVALILQLARSADLGLGKIAGVQAAKQLFECMDQLPPLAPPAEADEWGQVVAALAPAADDPDAA